MPIARFQMPDGRIGRFEVPDGTSPEQAQALISQHLGLGQTVEFPKFKTPEEAPDTGFTGAFKSSLEGLKGEAALLAGKTGLMDETAAEQYYRDKKKQEQKVFKPTEEGWLDSPWEKFKETLGGSLPYMLAPVIAGGAVAALPETLIAGSAATALGLGATGLASATQFTGSNLARQMESEGKTLGQTDLLAASAAAVPQAALDVISMRMIPGVRKLLGSVGEKVTAKTAKEMADQGLRKTLGEYAITAGKTATVEGATEAAQQFFERVQAGLSIADEDARKEYVDNFIGGAVLGGALSGPGHFIERGGRKAESEKLAREEQNALLAKQQAADDELKAQKAAQEDMARIAAEQKPIVAEIDQDQLEKDRQNVFDQRRVLSEELDNLREQALNTEDLDQISTFGAKAAKIEDALKLLDPEHVKKVVNDNYKEIASLTKALKAATKAQDTTAVAEIQARIASLTSKTEQLKATIPSLEAAPKVEDVQKQIDITKKQMQRALELGEITKAGTLAAKLKQLQTNPVAAQGSLFEGEGAATRYPEAEKRETALAEEVTASRPDMTAKKAEPADTMAVLREAYAPKEEERQQPVFDKKYDELVVDRLVDLFTEKRAPVDTSLTPEQKANEFRRVRAMQDARDAFHAANDALNNAIEESKDKNLKDKKGRLTAAGTKIESLKQALLTAKQNLIDSTHNKEGTTQALANTGKKIQSLNADLALAVQTADTEKEASIREQLDAENAKLEQLQAVVKSNKGIQGKRTSAESALANKNMQDALLLDATDIIDSMRKGEFFGGANEEMATGSLATKTIAVKRRLSQLADTIIADIDYAREAKGLGRLTNEDVFQIERSLAEMFAYKVAHATGWRAANMRVEDANKYLQDLQINEALQKAGLPATKVDFKEGEIKTGFSRNEYRDVQKFIEALGKKYTTKARTFGKLRREVTGDLFTEAGAQDTGRKETQKLSDEERATEQLAAALDKGVPAKVRALFEKAQRLLVEGKATRDSEGVSATGAKRVMPGLVDEVLAQIDRLNKGQTLELKGLSEAVKRVEESLASPVQDIPGTKGTQLEFFPGETSTIRANERNFEKLIESKKRRGADLVNKARKYIEDVKKGKQVTIQQFAQMFDNGPLKQLLAMYRHELDAVDAYKAKADAGDARFKRLAISAADSAERTLAQARELFNEAETTLRELLIKVDKPSKLVETFEKIQKAAAQEVTAAEKVAKANATKANKAILEMARIKERAAEAALHESKVYAGQEVQAEARRQTGLGLAGTRSEREFVSAVDEKAHRSQDVQAAFNFARTYYREMLGRRSLTMNETQRKALQNAKQKFNDQMVKLDKVMESKYVDPEIREIMRDMVTMADNSAELAEAKRELGTREAELDKEAIKKAESTKVVTKISAEEKGPRNLETEKAIGAIKPVEERVAKTGEFRLSMAELGAQRTKANAEFEKAKKRLESQKAPKAERADLANKVAALEEEIKFMDRLLGAVNEGLRVGKAQEEKGATKFKPSKQQRIYLNSEIAKAAGITPDQYEALTKSISKAREEAARAKTPEERVNELVRRTALYMDRLEHDKKMSAEERARLEKRVADNKAELKDIATADREAAEAKEYGMSLKEYRKFMSAIDGGMSTINEETPKAATAAKTQIAKNTPVSATKNVKGLKFESQTNNAKGVFVANYRTDDADGKIVGTVVGTEIDPKYSSGYNKGVFKETVPYEAFYKDFPQFKKGSMDGKVFVHNLEVSSTQNAKTKTPTSYRNQGLGSALLDAVTSFADANNKTLFLIAEPTNANINKDALSKKQLESFYESKGFVKRNGFMERAPKQIDFRSTAPVQEGARLSHTEAKSILSKVKLPKGLKLHVFETLPDAIREKGKKQGLSEEQIAGIRAGVLSDGSVFVVTTNHANAKDLNKSLAHEVIGHLGVEGVIGQAGMDALARRVYKQEGGVFALAEKLGVAEDATGAYMAALQSGMTEEQAAAKALREVIAHTAEARIDKSFMGKVNEFIKAMIGYLRAGLRVMGIDLDINTSDVYKMLRDARKQSNAVVPGIYRGRDGEIQFKVEKPQYGPGALAIEKATGSLLSVPSNFEVPRTKPQIKSFFSSAGLLFEQKIVSGMAGMLRAFENKGMQNSLLAMKVKYFVAMYNQKHAWVGTALARGVPKLVEKKRADGKTEFVLEASEGANVAGIADALGKANWGNAEGVRNVWSLHRIYKRAKNIGLDKMNFTQDQAITEQMLKDVEAVIDANPSLKSAITEADRIYDTYNRSLLNFVASTGAIPKSLAEELTKNDDYIPYYRKEADGTVVLDFGSKSPIKVGNIKTQPYLQELVGGDERIVDAYTGILQNTNMLMDMALRNLATRNTAFALNEMGLVEVGKNKDGTTKASGIRTGYGPASDSTLRFNVEPDPKIKGDDGQRHVQVATEAAGVPAEFVVEGLAGINTTVPWIFKSMSAPARVLRKFITVNPAYALRQLIKDPMVAIAANGLDPSSAMGILKTFGKELTNRDAALKDVERYGIIGSNVFTGTLEDNQKKMLTIARGKTSWFEKADTLALAADAATRQNAFNNFRKQGLSEMEAVLATYEMMPFTQRGTSRSLYLISTTVPFLNAQIQSLNVLYKALAGKSTFQDKLDIKRKLIQRGAMLSAATIAYAFAMRDDDTYKNATDDERYNNWFIHTPFSKQAIKIPTPFEVGILFKAFPEAIVNVIAGDKKAGDAASAMTKIVLAAVPAGIPTAVKAPLEIAMDYSLFSQRGILGERLKRVEPSERFTDNTSEIAKQLGKVTTMLPIVGNYLSPVQLEYLTRAYFGNLPIVAASFANPVFRSGKGQPAESRGVMSSDNPLFGSFFQPDDANGVINRAYKDIERVSQASETYKKMVEEGREKEAEAFANKEADMLDLAPLAGKLRHKLGEIAKQEREVRADPSMSPKDKRAQLDSLKQERIEWAKELLSSSKQDTKLTVFDAKLGFTKNPVVQGGL